MIKNSIALLLTLAIFNLAPVPKVLSFAVAATWSFSYIAAIYFLRPICAIPLILIESAAIFAMLITCIAEFLAPESQWFAINYERIMSTCYVAEIVVIIIGVARDGPRSVHFRRLNIFDDFLSIFSRFCNRGSHT